jgi:two-component system cell cycle sensor histidine kinase/response regulator CckA
MHSLSDRGSPHAALLDDIGAIIWEADPRTFQFSYVSRAAEALLGYSLLDWLSRPTFWVDLVHPDDREQATAHCRAAIADRCNHDFEYRVVTADGSIRWLRDIVSVVLDDSGAVDRLRGVMVDVTAAKAAASAVADTYAGIALEHGLDIIAIADADGRIKFVTPSVESVLGFPPASRLGQSIFQMIHPDDLERMKTVFVASLDWGGTEAPVQLRYRHADGSWRIVEAVGRRFSHPDGPLAVINARDITDRVQLESELRRARKMEALARIISTVAHDFNNLIAVIDGNADLALQTESSEGVREELRAIREAARMGRALTGQLLEFGGRRRRAIVVHAHSVIGAMRSLLERVLRGSATLETTLTADHSRVVLEGGALEQILLNLVVNAREAMRERGHVAIITRNVKASSEVAEECLELQITDTGTGMTAEIREHIFELYFTTKHESDRGGIGLATVYTIVRDAGGTIAVPSEPGRGSTFRIRLPLVGPAV